jgi:anti-sigma factor RsiW
MSAHESEERMVQYLLGELPQDQAELLEERYFQDGEYFEQLQALENELIRDFVNGEMAPGLRDSFEKRYRSSRDLAKKIELVQAIRSEAAELRARRPRRGLTSPATDTGRSRSSIWGLFHFRISSFQYATAAALVAALGFGILMWNLNARLKGDLATLRHDNEQLVQQKSVLDRSLAQQVKEPQLIASFILAPGVVRGNGGTSEPLVVPEGIGEVQFKLPLPSGVTYSAYRIQLRKLSIGEIASQDLTPTAIVDSGRAVIITIPSASLSAGRYVLYLKGGANGEFKDVQYYAFEIVGRS